MHHQTPTSATMATHLPVPSAPPCRAQLISWASSPAGTLTPAPNSTVLPVLRARPAPVTWSCSLAPGWPFDWLLLCRGSTWGRQHNQSNGLLLAAAAAWVLARVSGGPEAPTLGCCGSVRLTLGSTIVDAGVSPCPDTQDNDGSASAQRLTSAVLIAAI